jgi:hypothetical protein
LHLRVFWIPLFSSFEIGKHPFSFPLSFEHPAESHPKIEKTAAKLAPVVFRDFDTL